MQLPFLELNWKDKRYGTFIDFWCRFYESYPDTKEKYDAIIYKKEFTRKDIRDLFEWKNGMKIGGHEKKTVPVRRVISKLELVNQLKRKFDKGSFDKAFGEIGAIWQIYLLHIISPKQFPIFDQHVYRAHLFIVERLIKEIPASKKRSWIIITEYMYLFSTLSALGVHTIEKWTMLYGKWENS